MPQSEFGTGTLNVVDPRASTGRVARPHVVQLNGSGGTRLHSLLNPIFNTEIEYRTNRAQNKEK